MTLTNIKTGAKACGRYSPALALTTLAWMAICVASTANWVSTIITTLLVALLGYAVYRYLAILNKRGVEAVPGDAPCVPTTTQRFGFRTVVDGARVSRFIGCPLSSTFVAELAATITVVSIAAWLMSGVTAAAGLQYLPTAFLSAATAWTYLAEMHAIGAEADMETVTDPDS